MKNKHNSIAGFLIFLAIFFCIFIAPSIIKLLADTKAFLPIFQVITKDNYEAWIGYYGAILGGALTLGGVWWTITDQDRKRKEDMYASHKPFLEIVPITAKYSPNDFRFNAKWQMKIYIKSNDDSSHFTAINNDFLTTIKLKNVGLGIAKNIIFTDFDYSFTEITVVNSSKAPKKLPYELSIDYLYKMPYLLNNKQEEIPIIFLAYENNVNSSFKLAKPLKHCSLKGTMKINYSDCYNNWFSQKMNFSFTLEYYSSTGISIVSDHIYLEDAKVENNMQDLIDKIYSHKKEEQLEFYE